LFVLAFLVSVRSNALANYDHALLFGTSTYAYSASEIDQGTYLKFWWCGGGYVSGYSGTTDVIYYRSYNTSTSQWSAISQVISPVVGSWEFNYGSGTCNPTVVMGTFTPGGGNTYSYALYYTAASPSYTKA
jgi:hypothetical protein